MRSERPKPLHLICGRSMVMHVIHSLAQIDLSATVVVVGHGADRVTRKVRDDAPDWAHVRFTTQHEQRGTGDATMVGLTGLAGDDLDDTSTVLVLPGDTPLLRGETVSALVTEHEKAGNAATVLTSMVEDATGYGRIVRDRYKRVQRIVEHRDARPEELAIGEINTGIYAFRRDLLAPALRQIGTNNSQGEYYLTDVIAALAATGHHVGALIAPATETAGVNLQGETVIGDRCEIGPDTRLVDTTVGSGSTVTVTTATGASIGADATVGPYAHLDTGSRVADGRATGPFYTGTP